MPTQVAKSKFHTYTIDLRSTSVDLRWVAKRWKMCVDFRTNLSSTKVNANVWPNETQVERKLKTYVDLRWLASPFGQGLTQDSHEIVSDKKRSTETMWGGSGVGGRF